MLNVRTNLLEIIVTALVATATLTLIASTANAHPLATEQDNQYLSVVAKVLN
jgi:hypothetical protein